MQTEIDRINLTAKTQANISRDMSSYQSTINQLRQMNDDYRREIDGLQKQLMEATTRNASLESVIF